MGRCIGDWVTHSHLAPIQPKENWLNRQIASSHKCGHCKACKWVKKSKEFKSSTTTEMFPIRDFINCSTKGIIYKATCGCPRDYVGKTKSGWRKRILEHIGDITYQRDTPLARHMEIAHGGNTDTLFFQPIELLKMSQRGGDVD